MGAFRAPKYGSFIMQLPWVRFVSCNVIIILSYADDCDEDDPAERGGREYHGLYTLTADSAPEPPSIQNKNDTRKSVSLSPSYPCLSYREKRGVKIPRRFNGTSVINRDCEKANPRCVPLAPVSNLRAICHRGNKCDERKKRPKVDPSQHSRTSADL